MDKIICDYQLFDREQRVYVIKNDELTRYKVPIEELGTFITNKCYENDIFRVILYGNSKTLLLVSAKIHEQEQYYYNLNTINIEIIEGE